MRKTRNQYLAALMLLGAFVSAPVFAQQSAVEKQAGDCYNRKEFKKCIELLEKEVKKTDASPEALKIAMRANLRMGNPVSAANLATKLLARTKNKDADLFFECAQVAELAGDDKLAYARYVSFLQTKKYGPADAKLFKAYSYVWNAGPQVDALIASVTCRGVKENIGSFYYAVDTFLRNNDQASFVSLVRFALTNNNDPDKTFLSMPNAVNYMFDKLRSNSVARNFSKNHATDLMNILSTSTYPEKIEYSWLFETFNNFMNIALENDARAKFVTARRFMETSKLIPWQDSIFINPANAYIKSRTTPEAKEVAAKDILSVVPLYIDTKHTGHSQVRQLIGLISAYPEEMGKFADPVQMAKLVAKGNAKRNSKYFYDGNTWEAQEICTKLYKNAPEKQAIFAKTLLQNGATPAQVDMLFNNASGIKLVRVEDITKYIGNLPEIYSKDAAAVTLKWLLAELKAEGAAAQAFETTMLATNWDPREMANVIGKAAMAPNLLATLLNNVSRKQGTTEKMKQLISFLPKAYSENSQIAGIAKRSANGADPVYTAAANVFACDGKDVAALNAAAQTFLKAYKGKVPSMDNQAANTLEYTACKVLEHNKRVWNDEAAVRLLITSWMPRMKEAGGHTSDMLARSWALDGKNHKGGLYYDSMKLALALPVSNKDIHWGYTNQFVWNQFEPADGKCIFADYKKAGWVAISYLNRQINDGVWTSKTYFNEIEKLLKEKDANLTKYDLQNIYNNTFGSSRNKCYNDITASFAAALLEAQVDFALRTGEYLYLERGIIGYFGKAPEVQTQLIDKYVEMIKKYPAVRKFHSMASVTDAIANDYAAKIAYVNKYIRPILTQWPAKEWNHTGIPQVVMNLLYSYISRNDTTPELKDQARQMLEIFAKGILRGQAAPGDWYTGEGILPFFEKEAKDFSETEMNRAAIALAVCMSRDGTASRGRNNAERVLKAMEKNSPEIKYAFLNRLITGGSNYHNELKNHFALKMSEYAKDIPGLLNVDRNDPAYDLYVAQQVKREGNALQAWSLVREKMPLFISKWKDFDFDFALWVVEQGRKSGMFKEALELAQTMWMDEGKLSPANAANLGLSKGDIYRDQKSYPAAKIEYESLTNNKRYANTEGGRMAKFRLIELLILTQDFQTARTMLERLQASRNQDDQAEAYYLTARVDYEMLDDDSAMENLNEVFQRDSSHPEARLLQGAIMLRTNKVHTWELEIGQQRLATIAIPGRPVKLVIQDTNLSIIRGGKTLPVLVTTTKGNDRELVELMPNPQDPNKFTNEVPTVLGKAVPNNLILEVCGEDEIIYQVDPKFMEANGGNILPPNRLTLRFPARLYASSQEILSDEEQEQLKLLQSLELTTGQQGHRVQSTVVRPGNPIYVRVVDADMSKSADTPDKVLVDITCSSGDELNRFELVETGPATGVFEGKIVTGIPAPNTIVSDAVEGLDLNAVINSTKKGSWQSLPDGKRPKWLEIDTMTSSNFKTASITVPDPAQIKSLRVVGVIGKDSDVLATYPSSSTARAKGGIRIFLRDNNRTTIASQLQNLFARTNEDGIFSTRVQYRRDEDPKRGKNNSPVSGLISGSFYLEENELVEFKFIQRPEDDTTVYFYIDDKLLISGKMNRTGVAVRRAVQLTKGIHDLRIYFNSKSKTGNVILGRLMPDGSYEPLPSQWFDAGKYPELAEHLMPKGTIEQPANTKDFVLKLNKPIRYRKLRWVFEEFNGKQVEVNSAMIKDAAGKTIVPVEQDLSSCKDNRTLEVAAADTIMVKYEDTKRIDDNKAVLTEKLSSSFYNANIKFMYEVITMNEEGEAHTTYSEAARAKRGDAVIIMVQDFDEDQSEEREIVKVKVRASNGDSMEMELVEGEQKSGGRGTFRETLRLGDKTDASKRMLRVKSGDTIYVTYFDKENNNPGTPVERTAKIENCEISKPEIILYDTIVKKIEDRSQAALARIQMIKSKSGNRKTDIKMYKDQITAKQILPEEVKPGEEEPVYVVNSKAPLLFELVYQKEATHAGSTVNMEILTSTEENAAAAERREVAPLIVKMPLRDLGALAASKGYPVKFAERRAGGSIMGQGIFAGIVRLQLGSANDEINDLVSSNETFNILSEDNSKLDGDAFRIPTVIVSGSDIVTISLKDQAGRELAVKRVQLRSDGEMGLYDKSYTIPEETTHLGQGFNVRVHDPDRDTTDGRDSVSITLKSEKTNDTITMKLDETLEHSGVFTGSVKVNLKGGENTERGPGNLIWSNFGDKISFTYMDEIPLHSKEAKTVSVTGEVVIGSDGELAAFTKKFKDPDMAVKTNFLMAEALFELAKSHKAIKGADGKPDKAKTEQAKSEIAKGKRVLEEALRDYPNTSLKAQGEFLLANLSQQLDDYKTAISQFSSVISKYPDSEYAPKSYYQKAVCYEKMAALEKEPARKKQIGEMACEEYVRLTYLYPTSRLATDSKLRLGNYYYRMKHYRLAASVLEKFGEAHPDHNFAPKAMLLAGYASRRNEQLKESQAKKIKQVYKPDYTQAIRIFSSIEERYKNNPAERAEALYWAGDSLYAQGSHEGKVKAYQFFQRLIWDYPETRWAKEARGRMAANPIKNTR